jgi:hypothetical protein
VSTTIEATFAFVYFWKNKVDCSEKAIRSRQRWFVLGSILCGLFFVVKMLIGYLVAINIADETFVNLWGIYYFPQG